MSPYCTSIIGVMITDEKYERTFFIANTYDTQYPTCINKNQFHAAIFFHQLALKEGNFERLGGKAHDETQKGLCKRTGCLFCCH